MTTDKLADNKAFSRVMEMLPAKSPLVTIGIHLAALPEYGGHTSPNSQQIVGAIAQFYDSHPPSNEKPKLTAGETEAIKNASKHICEQADWEKHFAICSRRDAIQKMFLAGGATMLGGVLEVTSRNNANTFKDKANKATTPQARQMAETQAKQSDTIALAGAVIGGIAAIAAVFNGVKAALPRDTEPDELRAQFANALPEDVAVLALEKANGAIAIAAKNAQAAQQIPGR